MGKMKIDALRGIAPKAEAVSFEAERDGNPITITFDIYPFTTNEKLQLKQMKKESDKLSGELKEEKSMEQTYQMLQMILSKSVEGISIDDIKQLPQMWFEKIITTALKFEGVTEEKLNELKNQQNSKK